MTKTLRLIAVIAIMLFSFGGRYYLAINNQESKIVTKSQDCQWSIESSRSLLGLASEEAFTALPSATSSTTMSIQGFGQTLVTRAINRLISNRIHRTEQACLVSKSKQPPLFYIFALHKMRD